MSEPRTSCVTHIDESRRRASDVERSTGWRRVDTFWSFVYECVTSCTYEWVTNQLCHTHRWVTEMSLRCRTTAWVVDTFWSFVYEWVTSCIYEWATNELCHTHRWVMETSLWCRTTARVAPCRYLLVVYYGWVTNKLWHTHGWITEMTLRCQMTARLAPCRYLLVVCIWVSHERVTSHAWMRHGDEPLMSNNRPGGAM